MTISIDAFRRVTGVAGMTVDDVGSKPNVLDVGDRIKLNGQPIAFETAVETYFRMNSTPVAKPPPAPAPTKVMTRTWDMGRALWPSKFVRLLREAANEAPELRVTVENLGGFLSKVITMRVEGPEEQTKNFVRQVDAFVRRWAN